MNQWNEINRLNPFNALIRWGQSVVQYVGQVRLRSSHHLQTVSPQVQKNANANASTLVLDSQNNTPVLVEPSSYGTFIQTGLIQVTKNSEPDEKKLFEIQEEAVSLLLHKSYLREKKMKENKQDFSDFYGVLLVDNGQYFIREKNKKGETMITLIPQEGKHQYAFATIPIKDTQGHMIDAEIRVRKMRDSTDSRHLWLTDYNVSVLYVGEMVFEEGQLTTWNNQSGAYCPGHDYAKQAGLPMHLFMKHAPNRMTKNKAHSEDASVSKSHVVTFRDLTFGGSRTNLSISGGSV